MLLRVPPSVARSAPPSEKCTSSTGVFGRLAVSGAYQPMRPIVIRWTASVSSPVSNSRCLPRRRTPSKVRPVSVSSGGAPGLQHGEVRAWRPDDRRGGDRRPDGRHEGFQLR